MSCTHPVTKVCFLHISEIGIVAPLISILDEEPEIPDQPWGWGQDDEELPVHRHHRPHHHSRQIPSPWTIFPTASLGDQSMSDGGALF